MGDFKFKCPHCAQSLEAPEEMLGQTIECPTCKGSIELPKQEPRPQARPYVPQKKIVVPQRPAPAHQPPPRYTAPTSQPSSRNKFVVPAIIAAVVFCILYFVSPYWSLYQMRRAVENNDGVYVSDHVDFPQLRESLKATFKTQMAKEVAKKDTDGMEAFGAALGAMMIGPMVDALVTPEGLLAMMQGKSLDEIEEPSKRPGEAKPPAAKGEKMNVAKMGYEKLNRFVVKVADTEQGKADKDSLTLVFLRSGLLSWKLAGIRMQME